MWKKSIKRLKLLFGDEKFDNDITVNYRGVTFNIVTEKHYFESSIIMFYINLADCVQTNSGCTIEEFDKIDFKKVFETMLTLYSMI